MHELTINPIDLKTIEAILQRYLSAREVWAFGSRVGGTVKPFSDLDLAIIGNEPVSSATMADLREAFSESALPFKVDLVDWAETSEGFRKIIEARYVVLQEKAEQS